MFCCRVDIYECVLCLEILILMATDKLLKFIIKTVKLQHKYYSKGWNLSTVYIHIQFLRVGMQTAISAQCWWMAQAPQVLGYHSRLWLVVPSDEMSSCASRSQTSVTDRRLILVCQPRRTTRKIFRLLSNVNFYGVVDNKTRLDLSKRPSSSTNLFSAI